jgi:hypothetical protein
VRTLVVGLNGNINKEQADRVRAELEKFVGIAVVIIDNCSALVVVEELD